MRRSEREVTGFDEITDILRRADTIRLGLHAEPYPYVVPLSFGFETDGDKIIVYFHGAKEGLKCDLIKRNANVCVEADIFRRYADGDPTTEYESFIGFGAARLVTGGEAERGVGLMLEHCGYAGFEYDRAYLTERTAIYKITLDSFTGKRHLK